MKTLILTVFTLLCCLSYSQTQDITFGEISKEEIEMKTYEKDPSARAVILFDKGKSIFYDTDNGYDIRFTRHKRIKVFDKTESGYTEISMPYYVDGFGKTETIKSVEAVTYNITDDRITKKSLRPSAIYDERINERWYNKKFVFPDVQDGAILEYRYTLETPFHFNLPDWIFQDNIPTIYSEYQVSMIPFYEYVFLVQGISKFDYQNSVVAKKERTWGNVTEVYGRRMGNGVEFQDYVHTYVLKDIPAFKDESYISSVNDYIIKMDFQLAKFHSPTGGTSDIISSWPALNEALLKHDKFGKYLKSSSRIAKKILSDDLILNEKESSKKAKKIIEYVKNSFEWNGSNAKYASQSPKEFFDKKSGNAADINIFMIALLNEAEIPARPLILSTRNHGKIPNDYPFDHFTNYVVALVDTDSPFLADGTEEFLPYNRLPTRCNNEKGLIVEKGEQPVWIDLNNKIFSIERNMIKLDLDPLTFNLMANVSVQNTEYESYSARKKFKDDSTRIKEFYSDKIGDINRSSTIGYNRISLPYSLNFSSSVETEKLGSNIVIKPFLNLPMATNKLTQKERAYPVDFIYPWENQFESSLKVPEDFTLVELPEEYKIANDLVEIFLEYTFENDILLVKGNYKFKKSTYGTDEYAHIKKYLDEIVKYFNQPVILEKRS